jgi:hypothetical protein
MNEAVKKLFGQSARPKSTRISCVDHLDLLQKIAPVDELVNFDVEAARTQIESVHSGRERRVTASRSRHHPHAIDC